MEVTVTFWVSVIFCTIQNSFLDFLLVRICWPNSKDFHELVWETRVDLVNDDLIFLVAYGIEA